MFEPQDQAKLLQSRTISAKYECWEVHPPTTDQPRKPMMSMKGPLSCRETVLSEALGSATVLPARGQSHDVSLGTVDGFLLGS